MTKNQSIDFPGYVQAVAAVIALGVALYVGYSQDHTARAVVENERKLQGKSLSAGVRYEIIDLHRRYAEVQTRWNDKFSDDSNIDFTFSVPDLLLGSWDKLYVLGDEVGPAVQGALADARRLSAKLEAARADVDRLLEGRAIHPGASWPSPANRKEARATSYFLNKNEIIKAIEDLGKSLAIAEAAMKITQADLN